MKMCAGLKASTPSSRTQRVAERAEVRGREAAGSVRGPGHHPEAILPPVCGIGGTVGGPPPRPGGAGAHGRRDGAPRPGRRGRLARRRRGARVPAAGDHRPRRALQPAAAPRPVASRLQRRDLRLPRAPRGARSSSATRSSPRATARCCCTPGREWGEQALDRVNGMFAFAIWHDERRELHAVQPTRSARSPSTGAATASGSRSPPTSARCAGGAAIGAPRDDALGPFLARGLMPPIDESFFAGVHRLPGAHRLRFDGRPRSTSAATGRRARSTSRRTTPMPSRGCASCSWTRSGCGCAPTCRSGRR